MYSIQEIKFRCVFKRKNRKVLTKVSWALSWQRTGSIWNHVRRRTLKCHSRWAFAPKSFYFFSFFQLCWLVFWKILALLASLDIHSTTTLLPQSSLHISSSTFWVRLAGVSASVPYPGGGAGDLEPGPTSAGALQPSRAALPLHWGSTAPCQSFPELAHTRRHLSRSAEGKEPDVPCEIRRSGQDDFSGESRSSSCAPSFCVCCASECSILRQTFIWVNATSGVRQIAVILLPEHPVCEDLLYSLRCGGPLTTLTCLVTLRVKLGW